jgi:selenocysteine-specific elongation factor
VVLNAAPPRRTNLDDAEQRLLTALRDADIPRAAEGLVEVARLPVSAEEIAGVLGISAAEVPSMLSSDAVVRLDAAGRALYLGKPAFEAYLAETDRQLRAFHAENPRAADIATAALRDRVDKRLPAAAFDALLARLAARGAATVSAGRVSHPEAAVSARAAEDEASERLITLIRSEGITPSSAEQLIAESGVQRDVARKVLGRLVQTGQAVRIASDLHFSAESLGELRAKVTACLEARGEATTAELRDAMGVSRKYAVPLLEYFDAEGVTRRAGDVRTLGRSRR